MVAVDWIDRWLDCMRRGALIIRVLSPGCSRTWPMGPLLCSINWPVGSSAEEKVHVVGRSVPRVKGWQTMACKGKGCSAGRNHLQDFSDSDSEADGEAARVAGAGASGGSLSRSQVIHSGHFMVSSPHSDLALRRRRSGGFLKYDFDTVNRTWCQTYRYGPLSSGSLSIDPTLTRLFDCMSLAYRWVR